MATVLYDAKNAKIKSLKKKKTMMMIFGKSTKMLSIAKALFCK